MSKARAATDQIVKLIVGAGQASPSPPVGPALGSKGVKSMDFCKVSLSHLPFPIPSSPQFPTTNAPRNPGIQRPHRTHKSRHAHARPRHRPSGSLIPLRSADAGYELPAAECGAGGAGEGEAEGQTYE